VLICVDPWLKTSPKSKVGVRPWSKHRVEVPAPLQFPHCCARGGRTPLLGEISILRILRIFAASPNSESWGPRTTTRATTRTIWNSRGRKEWRELVRVFRIFRGDGVPNPNPWSWAVLCILRLGLPLAVYRSSWPTIPTKWRTKGAGHSRNIVSKFQRCCIFHIAAPEAGALRSQSGLRESGLCYLCLLLLNQTPLFGICLFVGNSGFFVAGCRGRSRNIVSKFQRCCSFHIAAPEAGALRPQSGLRESGLCYLCLLLLNQTPLFGICLFVANQNLCGFVPIGG
jgi:hypothetical protein